MNVIAAVVGWEPCRLARVAEHHISVDHGVEHAARANPCVERLAFGLMLGRVVAA
jgi:hypothetical protein